MRPNAKSTGLTASSSSPAVGCLTSNAAITLACATQPLVIIEGQAGTGKSTTLIETNDLSAAGHRRAQHAVDLDPEPQLNRGVVLHPDASPHSETEGMEWNARGWPRTGDSEQLTPTANDGREQDHSIGLEP
jgi:hypothetical protein